MFKRDSVAYGFAALCLMALPAHASVYVSGVGSDSNPCTISQPCRQLSHALTVAAAGGQVIVSGAGDFQPITVTKAVSIIAPPGIHAGIAAPGANAVMIGAAATDNVFVSGLELSSNGSAQAILIASSRLTTIDNCLIKDTAGVGITSASLGLVYIKNTIITQNGGIAVLAGTQTQTLIEHSTIQVVGTAGQGLQAGDNATAVIRDSVVNGNSTAGGIFAGGASVKVLVDHCLITNTGGAIVGGTDPGDSATITVSNSTLAYNTVAIEPNFALIVSFGNNAFIGNGTDGTFTGTTTLK